ncbi:MAG: rhodanese-like domain-containing protein [Alkalispirochaeta sp.]
MKKILLLLVGIALLAMLFVGCGEEEATATPEEESSEEAVADESAESEFSAREFVTDYFNDLENGNKIFPMDEFVEKVRAGEDLFVVDIRRAEDYEEGHVEGAVNVPWGTSAMWEAMPYIPQDQPVYVHCYSGQTAGQALITMRMAGIEAYSVNSGWNLGISRVDGYEEIVETEPNELDRSTTYDVPDEVMETIQSYYESTFDLNGTTFANRFISAEDANAILQAEDDSAMFISMCRPDDYAKERIPTSINIPYGPNWNEAIAGLPTDKKLIVHCYSGQGSNQLVVLLNLLGYDAVSLLYGIGTPRTDPRGWTNEGFEVESSS